MNFHQLSPLGPLGRVGVTESVCLCVYLCICLCVCLSPVFGLLQIFLTAIFILFFINHVTSSNLYRFYYLHLLKELVSPVCGIFFNKSTWAKAPLQYYHSILLRENHQLLHYCTASTYLKVLKSLMDLFLVTQVCYFSFVFTAQ